MVVVVAVIVVLVVGVETFAADAIINATKMAT